MTSYVFIEHRIVQYIREHPGTGLFEISLYLHESMPEHWKTLQVCRSYTVRRLRSLKEYGIIVSRYEVMSGEGKHRPARQVYFMPADAPKEPVIINDDDAEDGDKNGVADQIE